MEQTNPRTHWSTQECEHTAHNYFEILKEELRGNTVNKTQARRELQKLVKRSPSAIERKRRNISAVLDEIRHPWVRGYKPLHHYQSLLAKVVKQHVQHDKELKKLVLELRREFGNR
jgi:hypothetical protein